MKYTGSSFTLSTGRTLYAFEGLLNPSPWRTGGLVYGYDGGVIELYEAPLTADERREVAAYAIAQWQAWADGAPARDAESEATR